MADVDRDVLRSETVESLERRMQDLPMLPSVVARLLSLDRSSTELFDEVLKLTAEDPTFALQILKLAYVCGLLHDIGRFILLQELPENLKAVDDSEWGSPEELVAAEQAICGFDHAQLGWRACRTWKIPDTIADVVRLHHRCTGPQSEDASSVARLVRIVQLADRVSMMNLRVPHYWEGSAEELEAAALECFHPDWHVPMTTARPLAGRIPSIFAESERLIAHVGLRSGG